MHPGHAARPVLWITRNTWIIGKTLDHRVPRSPPDCTGCGRRMDHLLTVDSAEFDGGSTRTWLPEEDMPPAGKVFDLPYERRRS
ncbi:hypothetical protein [Streptomyces sp. XD-27]|uniref:hypothetical protein n=1 Tax=Streptomyces sp. XD-27 TaxID=3062779 RepID=UPI0026F457B4|nr:hypothetical protein [Streptomyces sp. XD-27]WKX69947.1 hypothetical protein Q3Y56_08500 [Streptomyces sp. XD-27]